MGIAAIFKNERPYVIEWLAFHRVIGIRSFFIGDDASSDGTTELLARLNRANLIDYLPVERQRGTNLQLWTYDELMRRYGDRVEWMAFIDADEFLVPSAGATSVPGALARHTARPEVGAVAVNWAVYGSSGRAEPGSGIVVERFSQRGDDAWEVNHHYKSIVRTTAYASAGGNPHFF